MKKKIPVQFLKSPIILHTFTRDQIERGDLTDFIEKFGEGQLGGSRVEHLFGKLVFKFDGVEEGGVATHPKVRVLLRRLNDRWRWSGFFLNLSEPLGPPDTFNLYPLLALGLCTADLKIGTWERTGKTFIRIGSQIHQFKDIAHMVVEHLRKETKLSHAVIQQRHRDIEQQFKAINL